MSEQLSEWRAIKNTLESVGFGAAVQQRFRDEKIELQMIESLTDEELARLGVGTIGDRTRLRNHVKNKDNIGTGLPDNRAQSELGRLFNRNIRGTTSSQRRRHVYPKEKQQTWTATFVCLADISAARIPTSFEKGVLSDADLGQKRIQFHIGDSEETVVGKLTSETGFPKLQSAGGFELLRCGQNCRKLELITCPWNVPELKCHLGSQCKIYLRPIQNNLNTISYNKPEERERTELCKICETHIHVRQLRDHIKQCSTTIAGTRVTEEQTATGEDSEHYVAIINAVDPASSVADPPTVLATDPAMVATDPAMLATDPAMVATDPAMMAAYPAMLATDRAMLATDPAMVVTDPAVLRAMVAGDLQALSPESTEVPFSTVMERCLEHIADNISDPVDMLRYLQKEIVTGRPLEVTSPEFTIEGETNCIMVDRNNLLTTGLEEIDALTDLRLTLEVNFYGESAVDYGGPRKEFFRLMLLQVKDAYFEPLRTTGLETYVTIGKLFALSIIQNGSLPQFMEPSLVTDLFENDNPSPVAGYLRKGMEMLGLYQVGYNFPVFRHLLRPSNVPLRFKRFKRFNGILKPILSEEGSSRRSMENMIYMEFLKYAREAASGRRGSVTLNSILQFVTGTDEEPVLWFSIQPQIGFPEATGSFIPTANTCINRLNLPRHSVGNPLPPLDKLFNMYDYAFSNTYYGLQ